MKLKRSIQLAIILLILKIQKSYRRLKENQIYQIILVVIFHLKIEEQKEIL